MEATNSKGADDGPEEEVKEILQQSQEQKEDEEEKFEPDVFVRPPAQTDVQEFNDQYDFVIDPNAEKVALFSGKDSSNP